SRMQFTVCRKEDWLQSLRIVGRKNSWAADAQGRSNEWDQQATHDQGEGHMIVNRNEQRTAPVKSLPKTLLLMTTFLMGGAGSAAWAQGETQAPAEPGAFAAISEIVVTATRRAERLLDVPASIQAIGGPELNKMGAVN